MCTSVLNEEGIVNRLKKIFKNRLLIDLSQLTVNDLSNELLGETFNLSPASLIYLFFDIEKEFNIIIPEEDIAAGKFNSFNNLVDIIKNQLCMEVAVII